ncbi:unnamed protein product, partial [marine sediment metagenome]
MKKNSKIFGWLWSLVVIASLSLIIRANIANVSGLILLVSSFVLVTGIYLKKEQPKILASPNNLILLGLIVIIIMVIAKVILALGEVWPHL